MPRIKFIEAKFYEMAESEREIEHRLWGHLQNLRRTHDNEPDAQSDNSESELLRNRVIAGSQLNKLDQVRIRRRARKLAERRAAASCLSHLNQEDRKALQVLRDGAMLVSIPNDHAADVIAASIHEEMPWMAPATDFLWQYMRRSVRRGEAGFRLPPVLLDGPPGIGKSMWARELGRAIGVPHWGIEASAEQASFSVTGSQRGWGSALPGRPIQSILTSLTANPVIVVDEIEKAGRPVSTKGQAFGLTEGLLSLLEPSSATSWQCPYYRVKFDMSWISWVLTSNSTLGLPEPFLSRLEVLRLPHIPLTDLVHFAGREGHRRGLSLLSIETVQEALRHSDRKPRPNLRNVIRMLDRAESLECGRLLH